MYSTKMETFIFISKMSFVVFGVDILRKVSEQNVSFPIDMYHTQAINFTFVERKEICH